MHFCIIPDWARRPPRNRRFSTLHFLGHMQKLAPVDLSVSRVRLRVRVWVLAFSSKRHVCGTKARETQEFAWECSRKSGKCLFGLQWVTCWWDGEKGIPCKFSFAYLVYSCHSIPAVVKWWLASVSGLKKWRILYNRTKESFVPVRKRYHWSWKVTFKRCHMQHLRQRHCDSFSAVWYHWSWEKWCDYVVLASFSASILNT